MSFEPHDNHVQLQEKGAAVSLPPSPDSRLPVKHTRQRSSSWGPTFVTTTVVPAPNQNEALNSLISSLTALTESAKQQLMSVKQLSEPPAKYHTHHEPQTSSSLPKSRPVYTENNPAIDDLIDSITKSAGLFSQDFERVDVVEDEPEGDAAPAPVAGYGRKSKAQDQSKSRRPFSRSGKPSNPELKSKRSNSSLRPPTSASFRPGTSASVRSLGAPSLYRARNTSVTSFAVSTASKESKSGRSIRKFFSSKRNDVVNDGFPRTSIEPPILEHKPSHSSIRQEVEPSPSPPPPTTPQRHIRRPSTLTEDSSPMNSSPEAKAFTPLNPSLRSELKDHLIPSRRSSVRHKRSNSKSSHAPTESRDLKSLNIDEELIDGDNSTVRRIRELQQAREKRHSEWRKEAGKSEKPSKRMSLPSPKASKRANSMHSSRHSMSDILVENNDKEPEPKMVARVDADDLAALPVFVDGLDAGPLTPIPNETNSDLKRNMSGSPVPNVANAKKHQRLSGGVRRSLSIRQTGSDDFKSVTDEVDAFLGAPRLTQKIRHPRTGRTIAFSEIGDPNGFVVFCCVGMGLTRFVTTFYDEVAKTQNLRIITPDRPGVGESSAVPEGAESPLAWVDDVAVICTTLGVSKFSLLAHSAGAIYALATALKMPQYVRGRIHLLSPWIPPSQLAASGRNGEVKSANLPTSHKLLSLLPASFMKAANSRFLSATSASIEPKSKRDRKKEQAALAALAVDVNLANDPTSVSASEMNQASMLPSPESTPKGTKIGYQTENEQISGLRSPPLSPASVTGSRPTPSPRLGTPTLPTSRALTPQARQNIFNATLTRRTWALATLNSNPALDLIICLERRKPIAFNYTDVVRAVVIHHGRNDNRVPLENVSWLSSAMRRCELRVLDDEGHGLMASAKVMSGVLTEIGREWEEWSVITKNKEKRKKEKEQAIEIEQREREREMRVRGSRW